MREIAITVVLVVTGWMLKMWLTHRERMKELSMARQGMGAAEQRLARVEHAVEAIALEVERIGEGQRYVTTLLGDRAPGSLVPDVGRSPASRGAEVTGTSLAG